MNFSFIFAAIFGMNIALSLYGRSKAKNQSDQMDMAEHAAWKKLLRKYLVVYLLATLSDWLQGPYVYALYSAYKYSQHDIAVLFVAGFGSSMIFGSFVGGMADWGGRRRFVILFAVLYAASCMTKHFKSYNVLMLGRLLGGVSTSLLFSVFEAWLIRSHADAGLKHYLGRSFSWAAYGNSVVAIGAGLLANHAAESFPMVPLQQGGNMYVGGYLNPFDIALVALVSCCIMASATWEENYGGDSNSSSSSSSDDVKQSRWYDGLSQAFVTTIRSQEILLLGIISSLFEGSMYIFVFMWTPALTEGSDVDLPFGMIFATFMVSCMAGSSIFSIQIEKFRPEILGIFVLGTAGVSMGMIALSPSNTIKFISMNIFEMTVGMYWPIFGTLKGTIVPESKRAAIYNLYRIPLNFIVLFSLLTDLKPTTSFLLNSAMLLVASILQIVLSKAREMHGLTEKDNSNEAANSESLTPLVKEDSAV